MLRRKLLKCKPRNNMSTCMYGDACAHVPRCSLQIAPARARLGRWHFPRMLIAITTCLSLLSRSASRMQDPAPTQLSLSLCFSVCRCLASCPFLDLGVLLAIRPLPLSLSFLLSPPLFLFLFFSLLSLSLSLPFPAAGHRLDKHILYTY